jgi:hypothetical protein
METENCSVVYIQLTKIFLILIVIPIVCHFHYVLTAINIHLLFIYFIYSIWIRIRNSSQNSYRYRYRYKLVNFLGPILSARRRTLDIQSVMLVFSTQICELLPL